MKKTCQYYWDKVAQLYLSDIPTLKEKLDIAEKMLSRDEFEHLKDLLEESENEKDR